MAGWCTRAAALIGVLVLVVIRSAPSRTQEYRLASNPPDTGLQRDMFQTAQWAQSSDAAESLAQMAARGAKGERLAALVKERQDLVAEWQRRDQVRSAAAAQAPDKRNREAEAENIARLVAIDVRIAIIDKELFVLVGEGGAVR
jgi:hypothetical protein